MINGENDPKPSESKSSGKSESSGGKTLKAQRYAIRFNPPSVVLEYSDSGKKRLRTVKLAQLGSESDVDRLTLKVIRSFPRALDPATVNREQVRRLVQRLVDRANRGAESLNLDDPDLDLNKVTVEQLKQAKAEMDNVFLKNQLLPGQKGFEYNVEKEFEVVEGPGDWDDSDDDDDDDIS
mmetsp:Transcript_7086/g.8166  ORF Transcript_7086/g.8166 Transcript_7086/m.8166 type:complete len:180 (+) Transcript_7086:307-846(+)